MGIKSSSIKPITKKNVIEPSNDSKLNETKMTTTNIEKAESDHAQKIVFSKAISTKNMKTSNVALSGIQRAFNQYQTEKGKPPLDVQAFMTYCKKKKYVKKVTWSLCQAVI